MFIIINIFYANSNVNFNPQNVESISVSITRSGTIISETGMFSNMDLILSIPQNTHYQFVETTGIDNGVLKEIGGSEMLNFKRSDTINSFTYSYTSHVTTHRRIVTEELNYIEGMVDFIEESEHILINQEIKNKAEQIVQRAENDLEKVALLAIWVNENMEYDINEVGKNHNSIKVYEMRRGVCVEYTNLFLAMVRSLNIPGRAVTGYVYSPDYGWQLHSWGEVYLGRWVGVDPTWLEVGSIDATHIPLFFNHNTILRESVSATVHSKQPLKWMGKGTLGGTTGGIEIKSFNEEIPNYEIKTLPGQNLQIGSEGVILFEIDVEHYIIFQANINPCSFETNIVDLEKNKMTYFLSPGKNYVPINYKVSEIINPSNKYFCPITISHTFGYDVVNLNIQGRKRTPSFDIYISKTDENGSAFKIYSNDGTPVNMLTNKEKEVKTIDRNVITDDIYFIKEGINKRNVVFYNENTAKYYDLDDLKMGGREIIPTRIQFQDKIPNDVQSFIEMDFEFLNGDEMNIMYYINGILIFTEKTMDREYNFKKEIDSNRKGTHNIMIKVKSYSEEFVYENSYEVFEPVLKCDIHPLGNDLYEIKISGPIKDYIIYINGIKIEGNKVNMEKGIHEIEIEWVDLAGYERIHLSKYNTDSSLQIIGVIGLLVGVFIIYFFRENIMRWCKCKLK